MRSRLRALAQGHRRLRLPPGRLLCRRRLVQLACICDRREGLEARHLECGVPVLVHSCIDRLHFAPRSLEEVPRRVRRPARGARARGPGRGPRDLRGPHRVSRWPRSGGCGPRHPLAGPLRVLGLGAGRGSRAAAGRLRGAHGRRHRLLGRRPRKGWEPAEGHLWSPGVDAQQRLDRHIRAQIVPQGTVHHRVDPRHQHAHKAPLPLVQRLRGEIDERPRPDDAGPRLLPPGSEGPQVFGCRAVPLLVRLAGRVRARLDPGHGGPPRPPHARGLATALAHAAYRHDLPGRLPGRGGPVRRPNDFQAGQVQLH
mmetsp:Transcript_93214/g.263523  ORF Transcript_93214/g.263523 Transcript_93214/m.263523 type:complete len:312 (-) Transcript_93214:290-1225(-)